MTDYFLLRYLKDRVFRERIHLLVDLKIRIRQEIQMIYSSVLEKVTRSFVSIAQECIAENGSHLRDVMFKK